MLIHRVVGRISRLTRHAPLVMGLLGWLGTLASGGGDFPFRLR